MSIKYSYLMIFVIMAVAGCATSGSVSRDDDLAPAKALNVSAALKFEDIPVPSGFNIISSQSFTFENDVLRVGILKYRGRADAGRVVNFYQDQMPLYNWRFMNVLEYGRRIMNFEREDQNCIIVIEPLHMSTGITITVAPKSDRAMTYKTIKKE